MSTKPKKPTEKTETIRLEFHAVKLAALQQAADKKGLVIENEMLDFLEKLYEKHVPSQVREFINFGDTGGGHSLQDKGRTPAEPENVQKPAFQQG